MLQKGHLGFALIRSKHPGPASASKEHLAAQSIGLSIAEGFRIWINAFQVFLFVSIVALNKASCFLIQIRGVESIRDGYVVSAIAMLHAQFLLAIAGITFV